MFVFYAKNKKEGYILYSFSISLSPFYYITCSQRENKNRSIRKRSYFLKNSFLIINPKITIHTITSPNSIIAPDPTTLNASIVTTNNIIVINAKIANKIITDHSPFLIIESVFYARIKTGVSVDTPIIFF